MISQPVSSIFPCPPPPSGTWRTPGLSIPRCCLPTSSSVCLVVISGNGPQFHAEDFATLATDWDIRDITSSPGYSQSNSIAERTMRTAKNIMGKEEADGSNPLLLMFEYRTTPVDNLASPAQLLTGADYHRPGWRRFKTSRGSRAHRSSAMTQTPNRYRH